MFLPRIVKSGIKLALVCGALYLTADYAANKEGSTVHRFYRNHVTIDNTLDGSVVVSDTKGKEIAKYDPSGARINDVVKDLDNVFNEYTPQEIQYGTRVIEKRDAYEAEKALK